MVARITRRDHRAARELAERMQAANSRGHEFRHVYIADDPDGPGFTFDRRRPGGRWHHIGWLEDITEERGIYYACGEQVAP